VRNRVSNSACEVSAVSVVEDSVGGLLGESFGARDTVRIAWRREEGEGDGMAVEVVEEEVENYGVDATVSDCRSSRGRIAFWAPDVRSDLLALDLRKMIFVTGIFGTSGVRLCS